MRSKLLIGLAIVVVLAGCAVGAWAVLDEDDNLRRPHLTPRELPTLSCPADVPNCRSVRGRVILVESVDPDGDGDLHVVVAGRGGVTAPGISPIDIRPGLRPKRDPRLGDSVAAYGPVDRGSFGQRQVAAMELTILRR